MKLDARGEVCPFPMLMAVEAMKKHRAGEVVVLITDHAPCLETIPPQAVRYGYEFAIEETGAPEWTITLTPKPSPA
jgi:TusA-related sulfurtransferase